MFPSRNSKLLGKQNVFPECRNGNLTFLIEPRCRTRPESEIYRCIKLNGDKRFRIRLLLRRVEELLCLSSYLSTRSGQKWFMNAFFETLRLMEQLWDQLCNQVERSQIKTWSKQWEFPRSLYRLKRRRAWQFLEQSPVIRDNRSTRLNTLCQCSIADFGEVGSSTSLEPLFDYDSTISAMNYGRLEGWPIIFKRALNCKGVVIFWNNSFQVDWIVRKMMRNCAYVTNDIFILLSK